MKNCIVHIPMRLDPGMASASQIRPKQMISAFKAAGYNVDVVEGTAKERKRKIKNIKTKIRDGVVFDFVYSESSTMPTLLTDPRHLPLHPLVDFSFFKYLKRKKIKIGLFYRDIYWCFPIYKERVKGLRAFLAILFYKYDLIMYNKYVDKLYLPTEQCFRYIDKYVNHEIMDTLPPGCNLKIKDHELYKKKDSMTLLYVGGIGKQYQLKKIVEVVSNINNINLIICCRENEWQQEKAQFSNCLSDNIKITHMSGEGLEELYSQADIGMLMFEPDEYRTLAMPYKTFEYLGHGLPVIASEGTAVGEFVKTKGFGWTIPYKNEALSDLLLMICDNGLLLTQKQEVAKRIAEKNRWEDRAKKVAGDISA